jgi:hypothetical protein
MNGKTKLASFLALCPHFFLLRSLHSKERNNTKRCTNNLSCSSFPFPGQKNKGLEVRENLQAQARFISFVDAFACVMNMDLEMQAAVGARQGKSYEKKRSE